MGLSHDLQLLTEAYKGVLHSEAYENTPEETAADEKAITDVSSEQSIESKYTEALRIISNMLAFIEKQDQGKFRVHPFSDELMPAREFLRKNGSKDF